MPTYRYRTEGVPSRAAAAFSPLPTTNPIASSWGLVHTVGSPSTTQIHSPGPQSVEHTDRGVWVASGKGSDNSPDYILPSLYWTAPTPQMVRHESTNELPIPAVSSSQPLAPYSASVPTLTPANPAPVQRARRMGGRLVQAWPKVSSFWPTFGSGVNNQANSG